MSFVPKALLFAEDSAFLTFLRSFLFKFGFRDSEVTADPRVIAKYLMSNVWPIIFVDHSDGYSDAFAVFEGIYKTPGYELLPFVFVAPEDKKYFDTYFRNLGACGVIKKPLQPVEATKLMKSILPPKDDKVTFLALQTSKMMLQGQYDKCLPILAKLTAFPQFAAGANVAITRCEIATGQFSKAEERIQKLLTANPKDVRALAEYCEIFRHKLQFSEAIKCYKLIREIHPEMTLKVWEQILLHLELDEIDDAVGLLWELNRGVTYKELAAEAIARVMLFMGLQDHVPAFLRPYPNLLKRYNLFVTESHMQDEVMKAP